MSSKRILIFIVLFLFLPLVIAQGEDFTLDYSVTADYICPTSSPLYIFRVINNGNIESQYTITLSGDAAKWATAVPTGFSLSPGKSKSVYTYITPKSDSLPGKYNLGITVSTSSGLIKTISHEVNVKDCHQIQVEAELSKESCPCDLVKYEFVVKNLGEYDTIYNLEVGGSASNFVTLSERAVNVKAGQSAIVYAYIENLCNIGKYDLTLTARNRAVSSATTELNIKSCFDYIVDADKDYVSLCEYSTDNFLVTLENNGDRANTYLLSVEGPSWVNLEKKTLILNPGDKGSTKVLLTPDYNIAGDFDINFKAVSEKGKIMAIKLLKVNVRKCHGVIVDLVKDTERVCNSFSTSFPVIIKNNGEVREKYNLKLEGPEWSNLDEDLVEINPGEDKEIKLNIAPLIDTPLGKYNIKVIAESLDGRIRSEDQINVNNILREECYKPSISLEKTSIEIGKESSSTVPVTIENKGSEKADYNLAVSGTASGWVQLNPSVITVGPGEAETVYLYIAPSEQIQEGSYNVEVSARLENTEILDSKSIRIGVTKEATTTTIVSEVKVNKTIDLTGFFIGLKGKVLDYKYYLLGIAIVIILGIMFFAKSSKKEEEFELEEELPKEEKKKVAVKEEKEEPEIEEWEEEKGFLSKYKFLLIGILVVVVAFLGWKFGLVNWILAYKYYLLIGVGILIILIILIKIKAFQKLIEFFEEEGEPEETEEEEVKKERVVKKEEKPVEREPEIEEWEEEKSKTRYWFIVILALVVLGYFGIKYKWYNFLLGYKYYIIGAIVALIIIIVGVKTNIFKKIMDFFEEEEDMEEEERLEEEKIEDVEKEEKPTKTVKEEPKIKKRAKKGRKKEKGKEEKKKDDEELYY